MNFPYTDLCRPPFSSLKEKSLTETLQMCMILIEGWEHGLSCISPSLNLRIRVQNRAENAEKQVRKYIERGYFMLSERLWELFCDSFSKILLPGLTVTIPLTVISFSFALIIAVIMALVQFANVKVLKQIARFYIWIFRGTPLLVQLFIVFYGLSRVGIVLDPFPAAVIVFSLNEGAYCAETVRAALESVPKGQLEAGMCAGMSYLQTVFRIVLPQAMRTAFPPLANSLISMVKDTSLAANITVTEMFMVTQRIVARTYEPLLLYLEVGLIYLIFSTVLTKLQAFGEKKLRLADKPEV